ncbi:3'-5' exonuclease [Polaribacter undariae]|uniref:3'-5' exonuclease n=1 Tax=Polaribacter sejongensis TaxID=985043 RepID=A0AAJ1QTW6_9FLAO|nr:3'-5' exonuclease [Polaribacter undariae]MDN3617927.1 3'-5' exonuclease [Polaribacter undariae]UWD32041.1 3'-5' exonuclease [Polaribacter undariae]
MSWFRKKVYPPFWKSYKECFRGKQNAEFENIRFIVFDTETTGLDIKKDRILSIGTIAVIDKTIKVSDSLESYLTQDLFNVETVKIHGILKQGTIHKVTEEEAIIQFLEHIKNAVLVAHHAAFDVAMINQALKRLNLPKLKNKVLDTGHLFVKSKLDTSKKHFSLDELSHRFNIPQHDRHTASGDAFITAILFVKLLCILKKKNTVISIAYLQRSNDRKGLL